MSSNALRIRDWQQDVCCVCYHFRSQHILVMKEPKEERYVCVTSECECPNFRDLHPATESAMAEWADEAHRKMYEENTKGLVHKEPHPYRSDEKGCPGILPPLEERMGPIQGEKMEQGKKFDGDKLRLDLIPTILLRGVAWILTFGAKKYGDRNWEQGILYHRVWGAMLRHLMAWYDGETNDPESGKPHLWHAACNLSFLMHFEDNKDRYESFDDRPCQADRPFNS